jgi:hypothetical protein
MEKNLDQWHEIAELIKNEKQRALADFHAREFAPGALPQRRPAPWFARGAALRPGIIAAAASLLLAAGLISFWLLRGSWQRVPAAPAWGEIPADSFFYGGYGRPDAESAAEASTAAASPLFTAWAEAGLERATIAVGAVDPSAPVEHGDPDDVRRRIGRAIHEGAFEQLLIHFQEFHDKEA